MKAKITAAILLLGVIPAAPAMAWTMGTIGIDDYTTNGNTDSQGYWPDLNAAVSEADGTGSRASYYSQSWGFANDDTNATGGLFVNSGTGGINSQTIAFYAGHGNQNGPFLGANNGYSYSSGALNVIPSNYNWHGTSLKWMVANACDWLYDGSAGSGTVNWNSGSNQLFRWCPAFSSGGGNPNGSLHAILSSKSSVLDVAAGASFLDYCMGSGHYTVGAGWINALFYANYNGSGYAGVTPAVLCGENTSTLVDYYDDTIYSGAGVTANPSADPTHMQYKFYYSANGSPTL